MLERVRVCWASLYSVESISYRRDRGIAGSRRGHGRGGAAHGRCAHRRRDVYAQPHHRRSLGGEHRRRLGPGIGGGRRRSDAGPLGAGQDHRRNLRARHLRQAHRAPAVPAADGVEDGRGPEARRRAPCVSDAELQRAARSGAPHRASLWLRAGHRVGHRCSDGALRLLQSRPETVWSAKDATPAARPAADPLAHVMTVFRRDGDESDCARRRRDHCACSKSRSFDELTSKSTA